MKKLVITVLIILLIVFSANIVLATTGTVNTQGLNLRDGASTSGTNIITKIDKNEVLNIQEDLGDWYKVTYKDYTGYVSKQYVDKNVESTNNEEPNDENPQGNSGTSNLEKGQGKILTESKVYVLPLLNSTQISTIKSNEIVTIISEVGNWKYIQNSQISGWIIANNIEGSLKAEDNNTSVEKPNNNENNSVENNPQNEINNNENNEENNQENNQQNNQENNQQNNQVNNQENASITYPTSLYVNVDAVNIRQEPTTSSSIVASVGLNTPVRVTGEEGDWYKAEVSDGKGYIMKKYLSTSKK